MIFWSTKKSKQTQFPAAQTGNSSGYLRDTQKKDFLAMIHSSGADQNYTSWKDIEWPKLSAAFLQHWILVYNSLGNRFSTHSRITLLYCPRLW